MHKIIKSSILIWLAALVIGAMSVPTDAGAAKKTGKSAVTATQKSRKKAKKASVKKSKKKTDTSSKTSSKKSKKNKPQAKKKSQTCQKPQTASAQPIESATAHPSDAGVSQPVYSPSAPEAPGNTSDTSCNGTAADIRQLLEQSCNRSLPADITQVLSQSCNASLPAGDRQFLIQSCNASLPADIKQVLAQSCTGSQTAASCGNTNLSGSLCQLLGQAGLGADCNGNLCILGNCNTGTSVNPFNISQTPAPAKAPAAIPASSTPATKAPAASPSGNTSAYPVQTGNDSDQARKVTDLVNAERTKAGLSPVTLQTDLTGAANIRAKEIVQSFAHTRPNGTKFSTVLNEQGITYRTCGENIAWGQRSAEEVMNGWMNSDGHRANILNSSFSKIGVGYYQDARGTNYWVQLFTN